MSLALLFHYLTLNLLTWRIWLAPNNASKWQIGFNSAFKGLMLNMFRILIHPSSGACDLCVELYRGLYCTLRLEVFALAYLFSGEC